MRLSQQQPRRAPASPQSFRWTLSSDMRRIHSPDLLANVEDAKARAFVVLFTCDAFARSILISLVPLQAYELLGAAQLVSVVYFLVGVLGLAVNLTVPVILHRIRRRWVLTIGAVAQMASALLFALGTKASLVAGLALQVLAMAMLDVVINLYLLDHIPRRGLNHFEPRRLLFAGGAFARDRGSASICIATWRENLTYLVAALATLTLLTFFWTLRLADNPSLQAAVAPPPSPLSFVSRFVSQPRLVLSWVLALGRNGWWVMYFIYTPIYVANAGYAAGDRRRAGVAGTGADAAGARMGPDRPGHRHPQSAEPRLRSHRHRQPGRRRSGRGRAPLAVHDADLPCRILGHGHRRRRQRAVPARRPPLRARGHDIRLHDLPPRRLARHSGCPGGGAVGAAAAVRIRRRRRC